MTAETEDKGAEGGGNGGKPKQLSQIERDVLRAKAAAGQRLEALKTSVGLDANPSQKELARHYTKGKYSTDEWVPFFDEKKRYGANVDKGYVPVLDDNKLPVANDSGELLFVMPRKLYDARNASVKAASEARADAGSSTSRNAAGDVKIRGTSRKVKGSDAAAEVAREARMDD
jgi:hypothetical protein